MTVKDKAKEGDESAAGPLSKTESVKTTDQVNKTAEDTALNTDGNKPNIIYVGPQGSAPKKINNSMETITLPEESVQAKGFYHEKAGTIIQINRAHYKKFVEKGK